MSGYQGTGVYISPTKEIVVLGKNLDGEIDNLLLPHSPCEGRFEVYDLMNFRKLSAEELIKELEKLSTQEVDKIIVVITSNERVFRSLFSNPLEVDTDLALQISWSNILKPCIQGCDY